MYMACQGGHLDIIKLLQEHGASFATVSKVILFYMHMVVMYAACCGLWSESMRGEVFGLQAFFSGMALSNGGGGGRERGRGEEGERRGEKRERA